jgi:pyruvate,water dikinase
MGLQDASGRETPPLRSPQITPAQAPLEAQLQAPPLVVPLQAVGIEAIPQVGGKNASLGEMIRELMAEGVRVPGGFATTAFAYRRLIASGQLGDRLHQLLGDLDSSNLEALRQAGAAARALLLASPLPADLEAAILAAYHQLGASAGQPAPAVAVRSSATAEDLPDASFAGQQETFLNVSGDANLIAACRRCYSSLFTDRAISYRQIHGFNHADVALSIGVQRMVRSDLAASGVMFTIDTESGFRDAVLLTAAYGLGETVVQGAVNPDEYLIFKPTLHQGYAPIVGKRLGSKAVRMVLREPVLSEAVLNEAGIGNAPPSDPVPSTVPCEEIPSEAVYGEAIVSEAVLNELAQARDSRITTKTVPVPAAEQGRFAISDAEVLQLARWGCAIERHYSRQRGRPTPMDIEWAKDGISGQLFILQARPETVESRRHSNLLRRWHLEPGAAEVICRGRAVGSAVSSGRAKILADPSEIEQFGVGDLLVTERTDPDWEPILKRASGVITNQGGRTCHAAIIAREMGITAIVGTGDATSRIADGETITASCAEGDEGRVYRGALTYRLEELPIEALPASRTGIMLNIGNPAEAFKLAALPCDGVGLARLEFIIANHIQVHPMALLQPQRLRDPTVRQAIADRTAAYQQPADFYLDRLALGMGRIAAAFFPKPVILRFSDFKSNEYAKLLGGADFEPQEENPMLGWRGACRYYAPEFRDAFGLECKALLRVREQMGLTNGIPMVPFCRTPAEGDKVLQEMARHGLVRGQNGLEVCVMVELPSNVIEAEAFAERFDGFSIGSNDLTQLTLGLDRDSALVADLFDERQASVQELIRMAIQTAKRCGRKIGICGQAASDDPLMVRFLVEQGIDSISLNPDALIETRLLVAELERR